jgi:hypothetical protein
MGLIWHWKRKYKIWWARRFIRRAHLVFSREANSDEFDEMLSWVKEQGFRHYVEETSWSGGCDQIWGPERTRGFHFAHKDDALLFLLRYR